MADENDSGAPEVDPQFEPVHKLTEQVAVSTGEEGDAVIFKMRAKLFRFDKPASEWKERGTGEVKILQPTQGKIRLVMRRDKTLKVCANHIVSSEMNLAPNIGSDRSWVWNVQADVSDGEPTQETLAIRFANAENAGLFKAAFEKARDDNSSSSSAPAAAEEKKEDALVAPAKEEVSVPAAATESEEPKVEETKAEEPKAEESKTEEAAAPAPVAAVEELKSEEKAADEGVEAKATESLVPEAAAEEKKAE